MGAVLETAEMILANIVEVGAFFLEFFGIVVLIKSGILCFLKWLKHDESAGLEMGKGVGLALGVMMGGELLHTIIADDLKDLIMLGVLVVIRTAMALLVHWENKQEEEEIERHKTAH